MSRISKEQRQQIVEEFARRHNGTYNPLLFLEEVRRAGEQHPAYDWFEWDTAKAAHQYQIEQARNFARDLRVKFTVEEVPRSSGMRVRETVVPMVISPMADRKNGGGYVLMDPNDPEMMAEHALQAAVALRAWFKRYQAVLIHAGVKPARIEGVICSLESLAPAHREAAE